MRAEINNLNKQIDEKDLKINQAKVIFQVSKAEEKEAQKWMKEMFNELN